MRNSNDSFNELKDKAIKAVSNLAFDEDCENVELTINLGFEDSIRLKFSRQDEDDQNDRKKK